MVRILFVILLMPFYCDAQIITTYAGNGISGYFGDGAAAISAEFHSPIFVQINNNGSLFISDYGNNVIRKINSAGVISTFAGNGTAGFSGDSGLATAAELNHPGGVAFDRDGNVFIADWGNNRIRKVDAAGIITTIAGTTGGYSGDSGLAVNAKLYLPINLAFDTSGNLYIADHYNHVVRKINTIGIISTFAGNGIAGNSGDGEHADSAEFYFPVDVKFDDTGNLYIVDGYNMNIRKINTAGIISTIAGTGVYGYNGDSIPATSAKLWGPSSIAIGKTGNMFIADYDNQRIRMIDTAGIIYTVAGIGAGGYSGDSGLADTAKIYDPEGVALDVCGNLYIADENNNRIRKVTYPPVLTTPTISLSGAGSVPVGSTVTVNATITNAGSSYIIYWMNHGIEFTTTTVPTVTYIKMAGIDTITAKVVPTGYGCWDSSTSGGLIINTSTETSPSLSEGEGLSVFPNPTSDVVHVNNVTLPATYKIVNIVGSIMLQGTLQRSNQLFIKELPQGVYVLEVMDGEGGWTVRKIVKE